MKAKQQHSFLDGGINRSRFTSLFIRLSKSKYCTTSSNKKGNSEGAMGSKSKMNRMKSYRIHKKEATQKLKRQKQENALDIISKSFELKENCLKGLGSIFN
ncbi:hypothetical protein [Leeuwenhoekiella sp. NPDC079379]|uniref:hypothetical protein n=1 Tax=Leeuwenhoekiella sp. NPDC079379 TaxID=3364122 RepID=UPI0037C6E0FE